MHRLKLTISYDGTTFAGWQRQSRGDTIQARIEQAISGIVSNAVTLHGAGRTDAGVHAIGQVAHADVPENKLTMENWRRALNASLPSAIRINRVSQVAKTFHARFSATGKVYCYTLFNAEVLPPFDVNRAWHIPVDIDRKLLGEALSLFVGRHDFRGFSANRGAPVPDTVREIRSIRLASSGPRIRITFCGDGFLYKMIRILTATAVRVSQQKDSIALIPRILNQPDGEKYSHVAPAGGLSLHRVLYGAGGRRTTACA